MVHSDGFHFAIFKHANPVGMRRCAFLRVGADDNTLSAPDSTVTLITLDAAASPMIDRLLRACATGYGCRALINVKTLNGIKPDWPAIARGKE